MGNTCCSSTAIEPEKGKLDIGSYESDEDLVFNEDDDDVFRRASNASQITHFSDELQRKLDLPAPRDSNISEESADEGFDDTDYLDENGKPREVRQSVGPFPNDRKFSTATQEAVYIYQASARAAGKIHDDHIKQHQQEALPTVPTGTGRHHWKKQTFQPFIPVSGDQLNEVPIVEEDLRNKTRMGRQSLQIQPQPEPRFITEYKKKKELHRKTQGNIFLYDFSEETNQSENGSLKCATPDLLKEVKERPDSSKSKRSNISRKSL